MATILYVGTHGTDDSTRASLPFHVATGAVEAGHEPQIALMGDAAYLAKPSIAATIQGVAMPSLTELLSKLAESGAKVFV
jgi:predicted peroxiredoxin